MKKLISIVTPCYNEETNIDELFSRVRAVMSQYAHYDYEHIFIDNASTDKSEVILRRLASEHRHVKVIFNSRNFGHIRSPFYGILQAHGDAVISMVCDLQDPPETLPQFLKMWEEGFQVVKGVKEKSLESPLMFFIRKIYYDLVNRLSNIELTKNFTGFGLYDKRVVDVLRALKDPYPYFRGLVSEIGFRSTKVSYVQPTRMRGITSNNFYTLYDMAMLGITNHSKVPLRICTLSGFALAALCLFIAICYLVAKLLFWDTFSLGLAPVVVGLFFVLSIQLVFLGILGEYIGSIHTQVLGRPLVIERERLNFEPRND